MRIISQDGKRDFNYENIDLEILKYSSDETTLILSNTKNLVGIKLAQYSTRKKAEKDMRELHDVYCGIVRIDAEVPKSDFPFSLKESGDFLRVINPEQGKVECLIWQFPQENEA